MKTTRSEVSTLPHALGISLIILAGGACHSPTVTPKTAPTLCRVVEGVYADGPKTCGDILVFTDGAYKWVQTDLGTNALQKQYVYTGHLDPQLLRLLEHSIKTDAHWELLDGISTCHINIDDTKSKRITGVEELRLFLFLNHQPS